MLKRVVTRQLPSSQLYAAGSRPARRARVVAPAAGSPRGPRRERSSSPRRRDDRDGAVHLVVVRRVVDRSDAVRLLRREGAAGEPGRGAGVGADHRARGGARGPRPRPGVAGLWRVGRRARRRGGGHRGRRRPARESVLRHLRATGARDRAEAVLRSHRVVAERRSRDVLGHGGVLRRDARAAGPGGRGDLSGALLSVVPLSREALRRRRANRPNEADAIELELERRRDRNRNRAAAIRAGRGRAQEGVRGREREDEVVRAQLAAQSHGRGELEERRRARRSAVPGV